MEKYQTETVCSECCDLSESLIEVIGSNSSLKFYKRVLPLYYLNQLNFLVTSLIVDTEIARATHYEKQNIS